MEIKGKEKDPHLTDTWKQKSSAEITSTNEKSAINFFNIVGSVIVIAGLIVGLLSSWTALITNVSFGLIIIGIGEILRQLNKISNK